MKLNRNTKKAQGFIDSYRYSCNYTLTDCYESYSYHKWMAEDSCRDRMYNMNGWGFKIMSYNSQTFTCGWLYQDKVTGTVMLNVETAYNCYQIEY